MKALTIIQPFAELIANGRKRVENRTWYSRHRGLIAIHAGMARKYQGDPIGEIAEYYELGRKYLPRGAIVAVAEMIDCVALPLASPHEKAAHDHPWIANHIHAEGPWGFVLSNVRRLPVPIAIAGAQQFWDVPADVIEKIERQLAGEAPAAAASEGGLFG